MHSATANAAAGRDAPSQAGVARRAGRRPGGVQPSVTIAGRGLVATVEGATGETTVSIGPLAASPLTNVQVGTFGSDGTPASRGFHLTVLG